MWGVRENVSLQTDPAIRLLEDLVAIDSVNPSLVPGARGEGEIARRIAESELGRQRVSRGVDAVDEFTSAAVRRGSADHIGWCPSESSSSR